MSEIKLPSKPRKALTKTPRRTIIFSEPKIGKTSTIAKLPKCLILDFEEGTLAVDAMAIQIKKFSQIDEVAKKIKEANYPYQFIALDTVSSLEELCVEEAERRHASTAEGKDWFRRDPNDDTKYHKASGKMIHGNIYNLPWGKGHQLVAEIFNEVLLKLERCAPKIILIAHSTITSLKKEGQDVTVLDIQLSKKAKFNATFKADAIGYMYRKDNTNVIDFSASTDVGAGGRHRYLEKEPIVISKFIENKDGSETLKTYWEKIFAPDSAKSKTETKTKKETTKK